MKSYESWVVGIISKRTPDSLRVLSDLCEAGLRKGFASANDIRECDFSEKNIIGATFKLLPGLGFVKTSETESAKGKKRHGGTIFRWRLEDSRRANDFFGRISAALLTRRSEGPNVQGMLPI